MFRDKKNLQKIVINNTCIQFYLFVICNRRIFNSNLKGIFLKDSVAIEFGIKMVA